MSMAFKSGTNWIPYNIPIYLWITGSKEKPFFFLCKNYQFIIWNTRTTPSRRVCKSLRAAVFTKICKRLHKVWNRSDLSLYKAFLSEILSWTVLFGMPHVLHSYPILLLRSSATILRSHLKDKSFLLNQSLFANLHGRNTELHAHSCILSHGVFWLIIYTNLNNFSLFASL